MESENLERYKSTSKQLRYQYTCKHITNYWEETKQWTAKENVGRPTDFTEFEQTERNTTNTTIFEEEKRK